jgi:hypothetical protein
MQEANSSNIFVEWVAFLFHIREIPGSNLGPETGFSLNPSDNYQEGRLAGLPKIMSEPLPSECFPVLLSIILTFHAIDDVQWTTNK